MGRWSEVTAENFAASAGLQVDPEVVQFWSEAQTCWPELSIDAQAFFKTIRDLGVRRVEPSRAADLVLTCACLLQDPAALELFERDVVARVVPALSRVDPRPEVVDEACQLTRAKLLVAEGGRRARLSEYRGDAPLWLWVKSVAVRVMVDLARATQRHAPADAAALEARLVSSGALDVALFREQHHAVVSHALVEALSMLSTREQNLLKLAFVDGLSVDRIGLVYGTSRATAARWVAAARERLKTQVRALVANRLELSSEELESFFTSLEFSLDRSLRVFFEST